ncbi:MAG: hypothetical protein WCY19_05055 [Candidatus Gastranaerophilaceae bacterium]
MFEGNMAKSKDVKVISEKVCVSSAALYELFGVDESTIVRWGQKGCPKIQRGWWAIQDVLIWRSASLTSANVKTPDDIENLPLAEKKTYYESKLKEAQLEAIDLKNAIAKGDYIPKENIIAELQRVFTILKRSMQGFGNKIAMELSPFVSPIEARRISKLVKDNTNNALEQISIDGVYEARKTGKNKI